MNNQFVKPFSGSTRQGAESSPAWTMILHDVKNGFRVTMHHALMASGIVAIGALGYLFVKPDMLDHIKALSPFSPAQAMQQTQDNRPQLASLTESSSNVATVQTAASIPASVNPPVEKILVLSKPGMPAKEPKNTVASLEQERVAHWLSRRYRVAKDATKIMVSAAYSTAQEIKLDPLLILSVMAIESRFNPFAESPVGAQGLMQVMSKVHHDKFQKLGGAHAALNPLANIKVGAQILKEYVQRGGSVEAGLKMYVGAAAMETDLGYGAKVLAEYNRLKDVAAGRKVPVSASSAVASRPPVKATPDRANEDKPSTLTQATSTEVETGV